MGGGVGAEDVLFRDDGDVVFRFGAGFEGAGVLGDAGAEVEEGQVVGDAGGDVGGVLRGEGHCGPFGTQVGAGAEVGAEEARLVGEGGWWW